MSTESNSSKLPPISKPQIQKIKTSNDQNSNKKIASSQFQDINVNRTVNFNYGDQKNNQKLLDEQNVFLEEKTLAKENSDQIIQENQIQTEKSSQLQVVKNRINQLQKKIEQANNQILKQDKFLVQIKENQQRIINKKINSSFQSNDQDQNQLFSKENNLKNRENLRMSMKIHKEQLLKAKRDKYNIEKNISNKLKIEKQNLDNKIMIENKQKYKIISKIHIKQNQKRINREENLKNKLNDKFSKRLDSKRDLQLKLTSEIENVEQYEKALIEEYSKTLSRKDDKERKLNELNKNYSLDLIKFDQQIKKDLNSPHNSIENKLLELK